MATVSCDIEALHREVMASQNEELRQGFFALVSEMAILQRELLEQKGYVAALLQEKVVYLNLKLLKDKELEEEKAKIKLKR